MLPHRDGGRNARPSSPLPELASIIIGDCARLPGVALVCGRAQGVGSRYGVVGPSIRAGWRDEPGTEVVLDMQVGENVCWSKTGAAEGNPGIELQGVLPGELSDAEGAVFQVPETGPRWVLADFCHELPTH